MTPEDIERQAKKLDERRAAERLNAAAPRLLAELKNTTLILRAALLCTSVKIAREARPFLDSADAAIAKAEGKSKRLAEAAVAGLEGDE